MTLKVVVYLSERTKSELITQLGIAVGGAVL